MYVDDIVIFSNTKSGLQKKLDKLHEYCKEWCLEINSSKTQVLIFNKPGKHLKDNFTFNNNTIECVNDYKYMGMNIFKVFKMKFVYKIIDINLLQ
jgi:hypothetical protein